MNHWRVRKQGKANTPEFITDRKISCKQSYINKFHGIEMKSKGDLYMRGEAGRYLVQQSSNMENCCSKNNIVDKCEES